MVFSMIRAARCDTSWTQRQSTMLGRCGPCCSVAPIGTITTALRAARFLISEALSLDQSISLIGSQRRQWLQLHAQPLLVQPVDLAVHHVEEDELVEPAHEVMFAHADAHVGRAAPDREFQLELLVRIEPLQV